MTRSAHSAVAEVTRGENHFETADLLSVVSLVVPRSPLGLIRKLEVQDPGLSRYEANNGIDVAGEDPEFDIGVLVEILVDWDDRLRTIGVEGSATLLPVGAFCVDGSLNVGAVQVSAHVVADAKRARLVGASTCQIHLCDLFAKKIYKFVGVAHIVEDHIG